MSEWIHSVLAQNESVAVATVISYDLPVNPLSFMLVTLKFAQDQADTILASDNVAAMIGKIEVLFKGSPVFSSSGADLVALGHAMFGFEPWITNRGGADDELTFTSFLLPLTRRLYSPAECFPRSTRGELILQITYAAAFTQIDAVTVQIETVELPDASPARYLRVTTLSVTPSAVGELDIELPIGNVLAGVLFFGTTTPSGTTATRTLQSAQLLIDNVRHYYSNTNFESWRQLAALKHKPPVAVGDHTHQTDGATYAQYDDTSAAKYVDDRFGGHLYWDFDPTQDGEYLLDTAGKSDIVVRVTAGDTSALRVLPLELVGV